MAHDYHRVFRSLNASDPRVIARSYGMYVFMILGDVTRDESIYTITH